MSDLGRLFFYKETAHQRQIENFTTVALAIAINHDDRPMRLALGSVEPPVADPPVAWPRLAPFDLDPRTVAKITAETQITAWEFDTTPIGYLDLVLNTQGAGGALSTLWMEVKVNAWESGDQLRVYAKHAERNTPQPVILTLGRMRLVPHIPSLTWSAIRDAVSAVPDAHHSWGMLSEFLIDEHIARPPLSTTSPDFMPAVVDVIVAVNERIMARWPGATKYLGWFPGTLRNSLVGWLEIDSRLITTAGPLRYGLVPDGDHWAWSLQFGTVNFPRVPLQTDEILRDATFGNLSEQWTRDAYDRIVLERRIPMDQVLGHDDVLRWFDDGLGQLQNAGILDRFLTALTERAKAKLVASRLVAVDAPQLEAIETADLTRDATTVLDADEILDPLTPAAGPIAVLPGPTVG